MPDQTEIDTASIRASTRGLMYVEDGSSASAKLGRVVAAHVSLLNEVERLRAENAELVLSRAELADEAQHLRNWRDGDRDRNELIQLRAIVQQVRELADRWRSALVIGGRLDLGPMPDLVTRRFGDELARTLEQR